MAREVGSERPPRASTQEGRGGPGYWPATAVYLVLSIVLTYPLVTRLATHIPGGNVDEGAFLWNLWWVKQALLNLHANPLYTEIIFYPLGADLTLYTLNLLHGVLALPLTLTVGPIAASNVLFIFSFVLSGSAAYLLALDALGSGRRAARLAALVAGVVYTFAASRFLYAALGQYNFVAIEWLPLAALFFLRTLRQPGWRSPVLAGVFAACAGLTEMTFVVFLFIFGLVILTHAWLRRSAVVFNRRTLTRLLLALGVFLAGFGPLGAAVVRQSWQSEDYILRGWGGADRFLVDLLGPLVPSPLHPLAGALARQATLSFSDINFAFIGYLALVLAIAGALLSLRQATDRPAGSSGPAPRTLHPGPRPSAVLWLLVALAFSLLALGPLLHINGQSLFDVDGLPLNIPLPYVLIHYLPILKGARVPGRFAIMATLAAAVLIALACHVLLARLRSARRQSLAAAVLVAVIVAENAALPLPLVSAAPPPAYASIAGDTASATVLQIPLGWRDGFGTVGHERTLLQSYQSEHGKPILGGNTSRSPGYVLPYFARLPIIKSILALQDGQSPDAAAQANDRARAGELVAFLNIRYVVVHGDYVGGPVDRYLQDVLLLQRLESAAGETENAFWRFDGGDKRVERRAESTGWVLYRVQPAATLPSSSVDLGTEAAAMYLPQGWSRNESMGDVSFAWAEAKEAQVFLWAAAAQEKTLALRAAPFAYPGAPQQRIAVAINGRSAGSLALGEGWQEYRLAAPAALLRPGLNRITLAFAHTSSPAQVLGSDDRRALAAAVDWIRLE